MVVQSIALPKVSGSPREHELAVVPAEPAAAPAAVGRSFHAPVLVPVLVAAQAAWLALLGYVVFRVLTKRRAAAGGCGVQVEPHVDALRALTGFPRPQPEVEREPHRVLAVRAEQAHAHLAVARRARPRCR